MKVIVQQNKNFAQGVVGDIVEYLPDRSHWKITAVDPDLGAVGVCVYIEVLHRGVTTT